MMLTFGIDLSLTATGWARIKDKKLHKFGVIRSSKDGNTPQEELERIRSIVTKIMKIIDRTRPPDLVIIEGLAYMARNTSALVQLSGLNYMVRNALYERKIPFSIVQPSTLKKFITGRGNSPKEHIILEVYKKYGLTLLDHNVCDSFCLAAIGQAVLGEEIKETTSPEREVVELIKQQITTNTYGK